MEGGLFGAVGAFAFRPGLLIPSFPSRGSGNEFDEVDSNIDLAI